MQGNEKNVGHSSWNVKSDEILSVQLSKFTSNLNLQLRNAFLKKKKEVVDHVVCGMNIDRAECKGVQSVVVPGNSFYTAGT